MIDFSHATLQEIDSRDLVGKTIAKIDNSSCNVTLVEFVDGTSVAIEAIVDVNLPIVKIWEEM